MSVCLMTLRQCDGTVSNIADRASHDTLDDARSGAIRKARSIMTDEIRHGRLCLTCWIVIKNADGHSLMTVPFGDAVELLDHPACGGAAATTPVIG